MADEHKGIALVILGIVAVIAIVGLVLLFTGAKQANEATGEGIYGGAIKNVDFPYWVGRGTPRNVPEMQYASGQTSSNDLSTHWNYEGSPKRDPLTDIPSVMTKCLDGGFLISVNDGLPEYYAQRGFQLVQVEGSKGGYACVYPRETMIGGIAGYS